LDSTVRCVTASHTDPIRHHGAERDATARDAADKTAMLRAGDLAQVDGHCRDHSANSSTGYRAAGKEHAHVDGSGLNDGADSDYYTAELHEADPSQAVSNESLYQSAHRFACNVDCHDGTSEAFGRVTHVAYPALVGNRRRRDTGVEA